MSDPGKGRNEYLEESWKIRFEGVLQAQKQLMNWLFAVHVAGIAGALGRASSKGTSCSLDVSLVGFCAGLLILVSYGAAMFYLEAHHFGRFRDDVIALAENRMTWEQFVDAEKKRPYKYPLCVFLGWASGLLGAVGIAALVIAVL